MIVVLLLLYAVIALILAVPCAVVETCFTNWLDGGRFHV